MVLSLSSSIPLYNLNCIPVKQSGNHCVKSVQIRSFFWSVFSCIRTEYGDLLRIYIDFQLFCVQASNIVLSFSHSDKMRRDAPYLSVFSPNAGRVQSECGNIRTRITPNTDTTYAVISASLLFCLYSF